MQCDIQCNIIAMQIVLQNAHVISIAILHCIVERLADTSILDFYNAESVTMQCDIQCNTTLYCRTIGGDIYIGPLCKLLQYDTTKNQM